MGGRAAAGAAPGGWGYLVHPLTHLVPSHLFRHGLPQFEHCLAHPSNSPLDCAAHRVLHSAAAAEARHPHPVDGAHLRGGRLVRAAVQEGGCGACVLTACVMWCPYTHPVDGAHIRGGRVVRAAVQEGGRGQQGCSFDSMWGGQGQAGAGRVGRCGQGTVGELVRKRTWGSWLALGR